MAKNNSLTNMLKDIGLNDLETNVYIWLLENKRSTGYKIAGQINKPVANTYKALGSLESKGAVVSDKTSGKAFFDTVPVEEFLNKIENEFTNTRKNIISEVKKLDIKQDSGGIYELHSVEQAYEKAASMIKSADNILLIDCFPKPLKKIKNYIKKAGKGEANIYLKNYCEEKIDNINQIASKNPDISIDSLAGQWMMIIKDTEESLIAMFSQDCTELKHCIWTKDKFLSFVLFNGAIYEFHYTKIHERIFDDKDNKINRVKEVVTSQQNVIKFLQNIEKDVHKK
ncbi:MAG: hypothetical protein KAS62_00340 [Candidatus Delongbacteria bacterium]|nr:hypothetical protein [Candidatus Delongbacteria bacterium]